LAPVLNEVGHFDLKNDTTAEVIVPVVSRARLELEFLGTVNNRFLLIYKDEADTCPGLVLGCE